MTQDTKWEEEFDERFTPNDGNIPTYIENGNDLKDFVRQELTSRDTYWKERESKMVKVIKEAVALVQELEDGKILSEADYELHGYGEACAIIKVYGEALLANLK